MNQRRSRKTKREQQLGPQSKTPLPPRRKESPRPNPFLVALVVLSGVGGLLCLFGVGHALHTIWAISERQALVHGLPDVAAVAPGELAILDGRIAASVPTLHDEFVAYVRERHVSGKFVGRRWPRVDGALQPLTVETGTRTYTIGNDDYRFDRLLVAWSDANRWDEEATTFSGAIRIQGIAAGSPVMAVGRLLPKDGQLSFHANSVVGISRADYAQRLAEDRAFQWKFAGGAAALAVLGLYGGWRGVRRVMR